ncbi:ParB N-terminal domain-containing protein [Collinsella aerofaciens]|uniref:ParB/RepB/Spo0J family partition protein n=1 Tax=Collinsella aerofaciens TaxID=74426 RepID=UPI00189793CE|nr:ParB N-terminal domain-containing protein [Collinsella aerofaciens]MDB1866238.1 ParB N-terminal domain-containing protein [Collinsella aerofaciens]MDB1870154.1 ParB N-terminal domain-containing protein [Collinsella aerofaciens]MDB1874119.1 ParB N-terminal domain-containing protein [Collinsella aerofaciens]
MQFEKRQVRLGDIRPSGQNPREDFGDIGALARSIEATGGEPLNPPVVVADGNVFRIVDGERRYRALSSIYGEDREVSALVAESMDEANELVAMLATDDKRQLTEAERARGVQQMLVLGIDEQRIERASRATAGQIRAARRLRGRIDAGAQVTLEQLEAASAFEDEKDIEAVLAAGDGWAGKADGIRRRIEREEAKAEDYDAFGDAGIPVVKEKPEGFTYKDWANCGLAAEKLEKKEFAAGTVAVWKGSYWDLYGPQDGSDAEPEKTEEEILAEQEAAREEAALNDLYRSLIGFVASGAFAMSKDLMACVCADRGDPAALLAAMGGDSLVENDERFEAVRDEFARNLKACRPSEYEAGCWLMAAAKDMAQLNNRRGGDDAEAWLDHYDIFCSAGFEPGEEDVWLMERVQASAKEEEKDE